MILGITGTNGAGKGTVVEYLVEKKGFKHYSVRAFLIEEITARGMVVDRSAMREVANDLRKQHGPAYVPETLFARAKAEGVDAIIESIRAIGEAEFLKEHGAFILAVDADKQTRYERAVLRGSETDKISFEEFVEQEDREMSATAPWDMNIFGVMERADVCLDNSGTREELEIKIEEALEKLRS